MKKFITFAIITFLAFSGFARPFFGPRYFEMQTNASASVGNNGLPATDFLVKNLVIDLAKIASEIPNEGLNFDMNTNEYLAYNLTLNKLFVGLKFGAEGMGSINLSKNIFEFIGNGNRPLESVNGDVYGSVDAFAFMETTVKFNVNKYGIVIRPTFFLPVFHASMNNASAVIKNTASGDVIADINSDIDVYTPFGNNGIEDIDYLRSIGFDLGGEFIWPILPKLTLTGKARIPIVPGHLNYCRDLNTKIHYETSIKSMMKGDSGSIDMDNTFSDAYQVSYAINRPMKFFVLADYALAGKFITASAGVGAGFLHPFTSDADSFKFYPEYYLGLNFNIINLFKLNISTEYTDMLFKHQVSTALNLRIIELDAGVSLQSSTFLQSFSFYGMGAFVTFSIGF